MSQITENLSSAGVHVSSGGWYDFDGDGNKELWFTVVQPGDADSELWIAAEYSGRVKALLVGHLPGQDFVFRRAQSDSGKMLTDFGFGQAIELVRHPLTGEPFVVIHTETVDPAKQELALFKELRQELFTGNPAAPIYARLLQIDRKYPVCPFESKDKYNETITSCDCTSFYYTLAFSAELAENETNAIKRFYDVWISYPESPFAQLARLQLEK